MMAGREIALWISIVFVAGTIGGFSVRHAQAQEFGQDLFQPDHGGGRHHHLGFNTSGKVVVMQTPTCPADETCFTFTATLHSNNGPIALSGQGSNSNCATNVNVICCTAAGTETAQPSGGSVTFSFAGMSCSKSPTKETVKVHLMATGGTGKFAGVTGSGRETIVDDPATGKGTITAIGTLSN